METSPQTVIILKGLPGCGKSTWARDLIARCEAALPASAPTYIRVNKDELRDELLAGQPHSHDLEKRVILPARDQRILAALRDGHHVIVDDTNLAPKHEARLRELVNQYTKSSGKAVNIDVVSLTDVPVEECIRRDSLRQGKARVGADVILGMARQYGLLPVTPYAHQDGLPWAVICDLDGTIALHEGVRNVYDGSRCHLDNVNPPVQFLLRRLTTGTIEGTDDATDIIYVSGRDDQWKPQTEDFLARNRLPFNNHLYMRKTGDHRDDAVVKQELFDAHIRGKFNIRFVLDDRNRVVAAWRRMGLPVFQVADGAF